MMSQDYILCLDPSCDTVYKLCLQAVLCRHLQEAKVHRRAVNNWHVARVAAERELTTDMLGTQRKCDLVPVSGVHICVGY